LEFQNKIVYLHIKLLNLQDNTKEVLIFPQNHLKIKDAHLSPQKMYMIWPKRCASFMN